MTVSTTPPLRAAWLVWGLGAPLYLMGFFQRVAPAVITDELMGDFRVSAAGLGSLSDRLGHRKPLYLAGCAVSLAGWSGILLVRLGQANHLTSCNKQHRIKPF